MFQYRGAETFQGKRHIIKKKKKISSMEALKQKPQGHTRKVVPIDHIVAIIMKFGCSSLFTRCILLLLLILISIISWKFCDTLLSTKTVIGDNLQPTPWHSFQVPPKSTWETLPKIIKCSYFGCKRLFRTTSSHVYKTRHTSLSCPQYFQWIHEDLAPWRKTKISREMIEDAKHSAAFRVVIVNGRLHVDFYYACVQRRALITIWSLLQLLQRYPGIIPDVDMMFDCMDRPTVKKSYYNNKQSPPPLFRYCSSEASFDIPFPDWSFWGWPETDLHSWNEELEKIIKGSKKLSWKQRKPLAYWKGNPYVASPLREELLTCNSSELGAEIFRQDWFAEASAGYVQSKIEDQCKNRFKIYTEGYAWSVSLKYILACDSTALVISPIYYDFFTRGLMPCLHYWPVGRDHLCQSIQFAVDWGNAHPLQAKAIGKAGQDYIRRNVSMDNVYDYMFHLLNEYAKLQKFQVEVPPGAKELCESSILCFTDDAKTRDTLRASREGASEYPPCSMPRVDPSFIQEWLQRKGSSIKKVEEWELAWREEQTGHK